jgi:hypothetical protein
MCGSLKEVPMSERIIACTLGYLNDKLCDKSLKIVLSKRFLKAIR